METLARVDALNLDKTGTITDGGIVFDSIENLGDSTMLIPAAPDILTENGQALADICNEESPNATARAAMEG